MLKRKCPQLGQRLKSVGNQVWFIGRVMISDRRSIFKGHLITDRRSIFKGLLISDRRSIFKGLLILSPVRNLGRPLEGWIRPEKAGCGRSTGRTRVMRRMEEKDMDIYDKR